MKSDRAAKQAGGPAVPAPSLEALRAFFDTVDGPAALLDPQLTILLANPAFEALCGVQEAAGRPLRELLMGVDQAAPPDGSSRQAALRCHSGQAVTLTLSRRGETIAVRARPSEEGSSQPDPGRSLSEKARVEKALLELGRQVVSAGSEEELVAAVARGVKGLFPGRTFCVRIIDQRTMALTSLYAEGRLREGARESLVIKRSAVEKTHLSAQELLPERVRVTDEEVPPVFEGTVRSLCAPLVASGQLFGAINVEYPEGLTCDLVADDRILIQLANQVAVAVRNAKLIDELTFVRKYLEELLEHANALILVANRDRKIVVFNKALSTLTGLAKEEVLGQDLLCFVPETERMRVMRIIAASLRGEQVMSFETRVLGRGGREVRVSFATSTALNPQAEVEGVIAIGQDLTMMKELERRVIQAEKLASLGEFAASVVHEINNPMTAVATYADALVARSTTATEPGTLEKYKKIRDNCERVLRFTRNLVSYARPAQDKPVRMELSPVIDMALGFCDHLLQKHGVTVHKEYGPIPQIAAVPGNMIQVFVNLVTNACHAMQPGGSIRIATRRQELDVLVTVKDVGSGISPADMEKIFEPFFTTKPDGKGTGLGLSIVRGIVENHGGAIRVESAPGEGSTFEIRLPIAE